MNKKLIISIVCFIAALVCLVLASTAHAAESLDAVDAIGLTAADYTKEQLMFKNMYPVKFWLTAVWGGLSAVLGFFALIWGLFIFTRKPSIRGFFGGAVSVVSYLFFTIFWAVIIWGEVCDGYHSSYDPSYSHFPDLTLFYWYWGLSAVSCVVWGFWGFLKAFYEGQD